MSWQRAMSAVQAEDAVALFEDGCGKWSVATRLGVSRPAVGRLYDRWRIWGAAVLVPKSTKRTIPFELKLELVQRFAAGEPKVALAQEHALSSPQLIEKWARTYRADGADGLRPKPKGRPKRDPAAPLRAETELERLRRENERLRAEVAYLGKLRALIAAERR
jgi:transposase